MKRIINNIVFCIFFIFYSFPQKDYKQNSKFSNYTKNLECISFMKEMVAKHQFKQSQLKNIFSKINKVAIKKVKKKVNNQPELKLLYRNYKKRFLNKKLLNLGLQFSKKNFTLLKKVEKKYKIDWSILVAILAIESKFGRDQGKYRVIDSLTYLAFGKNRRKKFYRKELKYFLLISKQRKTKITDIKGSFTGALGMPQFMPSSYYYYGIDFNKNNDKNLFFEIEDVLGSIAHYLKKGNWQFQQPIAKKGSLTSLNIGEKFSNYKKYSQIKSQGLTFQNKEDLKYSNKKIKPIVIIDKKAEFWLTFKNFYVLKTYNRSNLYAMAVFQYAERVKKLYLNNYKMEKN